MFTELICFSMVEFKHNLYGFYDDNPKGTVIVPQPISRRYQNEIRGSFILKEDGSIWGLSVSTFRIILLLRTR